MKIKLSRQEDSEQFRFEVFLEHADGRTRPHGQRQHVPVGWGSNLERLGANTLFAASDN